MNNPWELKVSDIRNFDNIHTFLIFCEDETSEPEYFKYFENSNIKINIFENQKSNIENVAKAITHCNDNNIIDNNNCVVDGFDVWCVYDRDVFLEDPYYSLNKTKFNIAHQTANNHKIKLAWSNDSFELWVLLHIVDDIEVVKAMKTRLDYYNFLNEYFKNMPIKSERLERVLVHDSFSYKRDMKKRKNFIEIVRPLLIPNTDLAISRAKELNDLHLLKENYADWIPSTLVYLLVERLLEMQNPKK